jgi:hypothetical protein
MPLKDDYTERLRFAIEALRAAEADTQRNRLLIRRELVRLYSISHTAAYKTVKKAAAILAGEPVTEWGGLREGAGRPRNTADE